jgi:PAN domain
MRTLKRKSGEVSILVLESSYLPTAPFPVYSFLPLSLSYPSLWHITFFQLPAFGIVIHSSVDYISSLPSMYSRSVALFLAGSAIVNAAAIPSASCGVNGYSIVNSYYYDGSGTMANLAACGAKCQADPNCMSFAFGGVECDLYTQDVASNVYVLASSPYTFYDVGCVGTTTSSTTTSSATTPSTTTSSATTPLTTTSSASSSSTSSVSTSGSSPTASTSTTSTISSTSSTQVTPTASLTCNVNGYDKTRSYNFDGSGATGSFAACSAKCQADPLCLSFAFGSGDCLLYTVAAGSNVNPLSTSPFSFYDKNCPSSTTPTTTTTTITTGILPTGVFCLQLTGSGTQASGEFLYFDPTSGNLVLPAEPVTYPTMLFEMTNAGYLLATNGAQIVLDPASNSSNPAALPLKNIATNAESGTELPLVCSTSVYGLTCIATAGLLCNPVVGASISCTADTGAPVYSQLGVLDGTYTTDQIIYLQESPATYAPLGFTPYIQDLCPTQPYSPPGPPMEENY